MWPRNSRAFQAPAMNVGRAGFWYWVHLYSHRLNDRECSDPGQPCALQRNEHSTVTITCTKAIQARYRTHAITCHRDIGNTHVQQRLFVGCSVTGSETAYTSLIHSRTSSELLPDDHRGHVSVCGPSAESLSNIEAWNILTDRSGMGERIQATGGREEV